MGVTSRTILAPTGYGLRVCSIRTAAFLTLGCGSDTAATWLASLAGQAASYRRSASERRQQLKWLISGAAVCMIAGASTLLLADSHGILQAADQAATVAIAALPAWTGPR